MSKTLPPSSPPTWDERYSIDEYFYGTEPNDFLKEETHRIRPGGRVLCLAEGEGRNAVYLAQQGFEVTAVDGSRVGLQKLERLAAARGVSVQTVVADLADFRIEPEEWDAIVSIWCHVPPALRAKLHQAAFEGLKSGGSFILESYHPRQLNYKTGGPPVAELMMTLESLRAEFPTAHFDILIEKDREIQEGRGHKGPSAVVQMVARRT